MSRLDELVAELCPDGVPFKKLGEIGDFYGGLSGKSKDDFKDGNAVFITYMNVYSNIELETNVEDRVRIGENEKQNTVQYGDVLFTGSSETPDECGMSSVLTIPTEKELYLNSFCFGYRFNEPDMFLPGFTKHLFRSDDLRNQITRTASGVTRFNVSKKKMENVKIPVPPLEVQREIARVLDNFTLLTAELTAELTARKKQYDYYRDKLLTFDSHTKWINLGDITLSINTGLNPRQFFKLNTDDAKNYYVTIREIVNGEIVPTEKTDRLNDEALRLCNNRSQLEVGDVLFSGTGTIGETAVIEEPPLNWNIKEGVYSIKPNKNFLLPKYLRYILMTNYMRTAYMKKVAGGTVKSIPMKEMKLLEIPLPSLEKQKELTNIIECFDKLCSDISKGIPAEITARQKQYEYYRDKLLTFKEAR